MGAFLQRLSWLLYMSCMFPWLTSRSASFVRCLCVFLFFFVVPVKMFCLHLCKVFSLVCGGVWFQMFTVCMHANSKLYPSQQLIQYVSFSQLRNHSCRSDLTKHAISFSSTTLHACVENFLFYVVVLPFLFPSVS